MRSAGFEATISAGERPQTYALDRAATGTGNNKTYTRNLVNTVTSIYKLVYYIILHGHAVAQLVEALRYKPEGRGFDSRWCHWIFSLT